MTRYLTRAGILIVVAMVAGVLVAPPAWATIYQCVDASGVKVFSDSAAQLRNCTVVNMTVGSASAPSAPSRPPSSFDEPQPSVSAPTIQDPVVELQPAQGAELNPAAPPPALSFQPCLPAVNPLNPFASPPCPSSVVEAPPAVPPASAIPIP